MNTLEKEGKVTITHFGVEHRVPMIERGCDGCAYQSVKSILRGAKPVYKNRELDHIEEEYFDSSYCNLFEIPVEGGPCETCIGKRTRR